MTKNKGIALIELMISLTLIVLVSSLITVILMYGLESSNTYVNYTKQQDSIVQVVRLIRKDIQRASNIEVKQDAATGHLQYVELTFPSATPSVTEDKKKWEFIDGDNTLVCSFIKPDGSVRKDVAVSNLIVSVGSPKVYKTEFLLQSDKIVLSILPAASNKGKYEAYNIKNPIVTEFSVKYKELLTVAP